MSRVIVADDDRVTSHFVCAVLRKEGYATEAALDVPALFALCERSPAPEAILLDLNMPGGSGDDSIRRLKNNPALADVRLIIVTGSASEVDRSAAMAIGATAFLVKPIEPRELVAVLRA